MNSSSLRPDPQRPKRSSATARTTNVSDVGTSPVPSNVYIPPLALSTAVRNKATKTTSSEATVEEQLSNKTIDPAMRTQLHTPLLISPGLLVLLMM